MLDSASLLADLDRISDPAERLRRIRDLEADAAGLAHLIRYRKKAAIVELRHEDPRPSWAEIGGLLGVSAQRAEKLSRY